MSRADSILHTASMARCVSEAVKAADHIKSLHGRKAKPEPIKSALEEHGAVLSGGD